MSLGIYCYSNYIYNVKVERYCWNQPYNGLLLCSHWSMLNIRCCSLNPFLHLFLTQHYEKNVWHCSCLSLIFDVWPLFTLSADNWFCTTSCTALTQLLLEYSPGHVSRSNTGVRTFTQVCVLNTFQRIFLSATEQTKKADITYSSYVWFTIYRWSLSFQSDSNSFFTLLNIHSPSSSFTPPQ